MKLSDLMTAEQALELLDKLEELTKRIENLENEVKNLKSQRHFERNE